MKAVRRLLFAVVVGAVTVVSAYASPTFTHCEWIDCGTGGPCQGCVDEQGDYWTCTPWAGQGWVCSGASSTSRYRTI